MTNKSWPVWVGGATVLVVVLALGLWLARLGSGVKPLTPLQVDQPSVDCMALSPDGKYLAWASHFKNEVRLWSVATRKEVASLAGHEGFVVCLAFSPDGTILASGGADHTLRLWDVPAGRERAVLRHTHVVGAAAFSPDGKRLASGGVDNVIRLWDLATGEETTILRGHDSDIRAVAFSPDGNLLASGSGDGNHAGEVKLWDLRTGQERQAWRPYPGLVTAVAFLPGGDALVTAGGTADGPGELALWDVATGNQRATLRGHTALVWAVSVWPDGRWLASSAARYDAAAGKASGEVKVWEVATGREAASFAGDGFAAVAVSGDRKLLAAASWGLQSEIRLWDVSSLRTGSGR